MRSRRCFVHVCSCHCSDGISLVQQPDKILGVSYDLNTETRGILGILRLLYFTDDDDSDNNSNNNNNNNNNEGDYQFAQPLNIDTLLRSLSYLQCPSWRTQQILQYLVVNLEERNLQWSARNGNLFLRILALSNLFLRILALSIAQHSHIIPEECFISMIQRFSAKNCSDVPASCRLLICDFLFVLNFSWTKSRQKQNIDDVNSIIFQWYLLHFNGTSNEYYGAGCHINCHTK